MSKFPSLVVICLCIMLPISSCTNKEVLEVEERKDDFTNEGIEMAILYGYNIDSESPNFLKSVNKIFEVNREKDLTIASDARAKATLEYSSSEHTASDNIEVAVGLKVKYGAFSGAASMKVSNSVSSKIKTVRLDSVIKAIRYKVTAKGDFRLRPYNFLTKNIKDAMKTFPVEEIEKKIGVFFATSLNLGGEVRKSYIMQAMESDTESTVKMELAASYGKGCIGVASSRSTSLSSRRSNKDAKMTMTWAAQGGHSTIWLGKDLRDADSLNEITQKWAKTIKVDNLYPLNFQLVEMWKLVKEVDAKKGQEFEDYLKAKWKKQKNAFHPMEFIHPEDPCYHGSDKKQRNYRGRQGRTATGRTCQRWSTQYPHSHSFKPENYPDAGLEVNYCRNPNSATETWCYTTDKNKRWEYCAVPHCENCYSGHDSKQQDYRGRKSTTRHGYRCQNWLSQYPQSHSKNKPSADADEGIGNHNYCRNPSNARQSWCYVTNRSLRWDYCTLPRC